ncbi:hypothetical protein E3T54_13610 [Cryobacterium sp. Sr8]|nr:hypothetical protein E3T54_13610 [Cryobacterium sp. Sr8]
MNPHENRYHELARLRERASRAYEKNTRTAHVARAHETRVAAQIKADAAAAKLPALRETLAAIAHLAPKSHEDAAAWEYHEMYRYQTTGEFFAYSREHVSARLLELEAIAPKAAEYRRTERARILALPTPTENELAAEREAEAARIENVSRAIASAFRSAIPDAAGSRTFTF